jgi:hypothetical protein
LEDNAVIGKSVFQIGQAYRMAVREKPDAFAHMWVGRMLRAVDQFIVLGDASRIVDVSPCGDSDTFKFMEAERAPGNGEIIINLSAVVGAVQWAQQLPALMGSSKTGATKS